MAAPAGEAHASAGRRQAVGDPGRCGGAARAERCRAGVSAQRCGRATAPGIHGGRHAAEVQAYSIDPVGWR